MTAISPSAHLYQQPAAYTFITSDICGVFAATLIVIELATTLASSRLDFCNSFLYSIADTDLTKLQRVRNRLACFVTKSPPFICSVPLLRSLHACGL